MIDDAIGELAPMVGVSAACVAVGRPRATHYRRHRKSPLPAKRERVAAPQPRALDQVERKEILRVLHEPQHVDEAPGVAGSGAPIPSVMFPMSGTTGNSSSKRAPATWSERNWWAGDIRHVDISRAPACDKTERDALDEGGSREPGFHPWQGLSFSHCSLGRDQVSLRTGSGSPTGGLRLVTWRRRRVLKERSGHPTP